MGVGLGYAIAAAVTQPGRAVVAVEGDSAFGFSGMEVETICRCVWLQGRGEGSLEKRKRKQQQGGLLADPIGGFQALGLLALLSAPTSTQLPGRGFAMPCPDRPQPLCCLP
jgi:hypothetical protein